MTEHRDESGSESPAAIEREINEARQRLDSTLLAIEDRLSPEHLMEQAMNYIREEAGEWGDELGSFIRRNPLPMALLGLGIGWLTVSLIRGRGSDEDDTDYIAGAEGYYSAARDEDLGGDPDLYDSDRGNGRFEQARGYVASATEAARSSMADRAAEVGDRMSGFTRGARDRLHSLSENARDLADNARERITNVAGGTMEQASHWGEVARGGVDRLQSEFTRAAEERPLMLGAVGLGIGALIGLCLPSTRAEARLIGPRRDELLDELREAGRERLHGLADVARDSGEAAREQFDPKDEVRKSASQMMDKAQKAAEAALDTAVSEVETNVLGTGEKESPANQGVNGGAPKP